MFKCKHLTHSNVVDFTLLQPVKYKQFAVINNKPRGFINQFRLFYGSETLSESISIILAKNRGHLTTKQRRDSKIFY
jgi:hypothetical protein